MQGYGSSKHCITSTISVTRYSS